MKNSLFILAGAAALSLASCSQEKTTEVTTAPADGTAMATSNMADTDAAIEARAQRIADKMVADMKITDEATKTKIRTIYVNRSKRYGELKTKYATDTTGMAAAMRESDMATDTEFRDVYTDPTQYQAYESSRSAYNESNYMDDASMSSTDNTSTTSTDATSSTTTTDNSMMSSDAGTMSSPDAASGTAVSKLKAKAADGSKIKVKDDGTVKTKDADGSKSKN